MRDILLPTLRLHYTATLHLLPPRCYISSIHSGYKISLAHRRSSRSHNLYHWHHHRNASSSHHDLRNAGPLFQGLSKWCTTTIATTAIPTTTTPQSTPPPSPPPSPEEKHSNDDSFQEFLNELDEKHKGQPPPEEVQAALLRSFKTAHQELNDSTAVYGVEDADLKDGEDADLEDGKDADLEDGHRRRAALLAKRRREAPPTTLALLHKKILDTKTFKQGSRLKL
jgi:hypothetical protein